MWNFRTKIHKSVNDGNVVEVIEVDGVRSLYLGSVTIQSSMRVKSPFALELAYSRGMMCFLLFDHKVQYALSIGLGGGSVQKYIYANCPEIQQTVVEINPQVIATAYSHFYVPVNEPTLTIIEADGIAHLENNPNSADLLMIDAFDGQGIPPEFCSQTFFDTCEAALKSDGIFEINLWGSDKNFDIYLRRIEQSFNQRVLMMPTGKPGNIIVFGFKLHEDIKIAQLRTRAKALQEKHAIDFMGFIDRLCDHNPHNKLQFFSESA
jgi:spermidine synthase